ncbi:hypothetical protein LAV73_09190 [Lysinibacillus xylanilyticus]|uniref:hypothetical protein n=1 Tax=Lysinibacillus xylanilyticus TaxID=582475 RepID=UPI002B2492AB|nr:hypothetical protein [Lysinibacillus xylanilyticus]MEB2280170.1 hypothetical protein [Lysinibacillus xylanilyticus]
MRFYFEDVNIDSESVQDYFEKFPFVIRDVPQSLIEISGLYLPECDENWFPTWMNKINGFPLYLFIEVEDYINKEFNLFCAQYSFEPQNFDKEGKFKIIEIENAEKFKQMFSLAITISCAGALVMWATQKNIFFGKNIQINKRIQILENQSIFVIGHDCEYTLIISNNPNFKNAEEMSKTFPKDTDCKRNF